MLHAIDHEFAYMLPDGCTEISADEYTRLTEPKTPTSDELAAAARAKRDTLLAETDYLLMPDYPITAEKLTLVKTYRQLLRDITEQLGFPIDIAWPPHPML